MSNLRKSAREEIGDLLPLLLEQLQGKVVEDLYSPEHFGNILLVIDSPLLCVRIDRDRGIVQTEVAPPSDRSNWLRFDLAIEVAREVEWPIRDYSVEESIATLLENLPQLIAGFGPDYALTRERLKARLPSWRARAAHFNREKFLASEAAARRIEKDWKKDWKKRGSIWGLP